MNEIKLCKNCEYYRPLKIFGLFTIRSDLARCANPIGSSPVDGLPDKFCNIERDRFLSGRDMCGIDAKFFKERK